MNTQKKKTDSMLIVVRIIGVIIAIAFIWGLFQKSGDKIDKPFLGDHFTDSFIDIVGVILVLAGIAWITGLVSLIKGGEEVYSYGDKGSGWKNVGVGAALFVAGVLAIWLT